MANLGTSLESMNTKLTNLKIENDRLKNELTLREAFKSETTQRIEILSNALNMLKSCVTEMNERAASCKSINYLISQKCI